MRLVRPALLALLAATVPVALTAGVHSAQAADTTVNVNVAADAYVDSAHANTNPGIQASGAGGGGGGAVGQSGAAAQTGGNGSNGVVIIREYA